MNKLLKFAKSIKDFRLKRKKLHPVENIVFTTIVAVICGMETWEEIEDFGNARKDFLKDHLDLKNGIPSHDTFNRFFSLFDPEKFQTLFIGWIHELLGIKVEEGNQVAIDGKSLRGSGTKRNRMVHLLHAFLVEQECILAQKKTAEKSNEITAIPELLEILDLKGAIVSIDAMGCQTDIAKKIIEKEADYFLAVKENQKTLYEDITTAFLVFPERNDNTFTTEEMNGSRIEKRTCKVIDDLTHLKNPEQWMGLKKIIKIETQTYLKSEQKEVKDSRYYIASFEASPQRYLEVSRNHWAIENKLHWSLDVIFNEDKSRKRNNNVAENFSIILKIVLKLMRAKQKERKKKGKKHYSINRMKKILAWDPLAFDNIFNF